jgi:hypothetical protein
MGKQPFCPEPATCSAGSLAPRDGRIALTEFVAVDAVSRHRIASGDGGSTQDVLAPRDSLKMMRPDAVASATEVVVDQAKGRLASKEVVSERWALLRPEDAVACGVEPTDPDGAAICAARVNLRPEAFLCRYHAFIIQLEGDVRQLPAAPADGSADGPAT